MNQTTVQLALPAEQVLRVQSALMREASEQLFTGHVSRAMHLRAVARSVSQQCLAQWERFEAAGCSQEMRDTAERVAAG